jgi:endonuclease/exonuclease/phosphatase family metal-dependent hydrolase
MWSAAALAATGLPVAAQTTVTLNTPRSQVVYATLRGGSYANKNFGTILESRRGSDMSYERRPMVKFDTQNYIPAGSSVTSAILTMTVSGADKGLTRHVAAYQVTNSWTETQTTWNLRRTSQPWRTKGGDLGTKLATALVTDSVGSKVVFDVTPLVKAAVAGQLGSSRYTRIMLIDLDAPTNLSWRSYYTPDDPNVANRPTLVVTYGGGSSPTPTPDPTPTSTGTALKVLEYNVHHNGIGTDGKNDPNRIADWVAKINPDIVSLVEVESWNGYYSGDGVALYKTLLESRTGHTWYTLDIQKYGDWTSEGQRNAILSKYPLNSTYRHEYSVGDPRTIGGVSITVNGRTINFMSTHWDWQVASARRTQASETVPYASGFSEDRIILGDFNATPGATEINTMTNGYVDAWVKAVSLGVDKSAPDNPDGNTRNGRIDYVFYSKSAKHLALTRAEVVDTRDSNGHMPSDHRPLLATFTVN